MRTAVARAVTVVVVAVSMTFLSACSVSPKTISGCVLEPGTSCVGANLKNADLSGVDLEGSNFEDADFSKANLTGANFTNANLNGASFTNANLNDANFTGAKDAKLSLGTVTATVTCQDGNEWTPGQTASPCSDPAKESATLSNDGATLVIVNVTEFQMVAGVGVNANECAPSGSVGGLRTYTWSLTPEGGSPIETATQYVHWVRVPASSGPLQGQQVCNTVLQFDRAGGEKWTDVPSAILKYGTANQVVGTVPQPASTTYLNQNGSTGQFTASK
jgi:hypothetical protein